MVVPAEMKGAIRLIGLRGAETGLMAPRKKPDATDTEPPEEEQPDTTAT